MNKNVLMAAIAATGLLIVGGANAATVTDTFQVTATVNANCKISAATDMAFGVYTPEVADVTSTSTISVRCSKGAAYSVGLNEGTGASATTSTRKMTHATLTDTLGYALYSDAGRTVNWGNVTGEWVTGTGAGLGTVAAQNLTVYGKLPDDVANRAASVGSYSDTITVTVTY